MVHYLLRDHRLKFPHNIVFLSLKTVFVIAISVDPDEMLHYVAFYLGLHCFQKNTLRGH